MSSTMTGMCVFCSIASGDVAADVVYEDDVVVAFLDARPLFPGHCLVTPRAHYETLTDVPIDVLGPLFEIVQRVDRAVQDAMEAQGTFVAMNNVVSQSVPHLHVHVVPRNRKDGLRGFFWPRTDYDDDVHRRRVAAAIRERLAER